MTVIEIRPHRWGWKVFDAPGVEPVFPPARASGRVRFVFWIQSASWNAPLRLTKQIENCDVPPDARPSSKRNAAREGDTPLPISFYGSGRTKVVWAGALYHAGF